MDKRVAVIGIIVEKEESVEVLNALLHDFGDDIVGRMGIPYRERKIHVISIVVDATEDRIAQLAEKLTAISGVSVSTAYSKVVD